MTDEQYLTIRDRLFAAFGATGVARVSGPDGQYVFAMLEKPRDDLPAEIDGVPIRYQVVGRIIALEETGP